MTIICFLWLFLVLFLKPVITNNPPLFKMVNGKRVYGKQPDILMLQNMFIAEGTQILRRPVTIIKHYKNESAHRNDDYLLVNELAKKIKVLCWVMTRPENHMKQALHVKKTWGKRCNKLLFMSSTEDPAIPTIKLPVSDGREFQWAKMKAAFRYLYEHHRNDADWFFKAEDNTYAIIEHLRYMLLSQKTKYPTYFGFRDHAIWNQHLPRNSASFVLSREALRRLAKSMQQPACSKRLAGAHREEDNVDFAMCLRFLGVRVMDTRDAIGRARFVQTRPGEMFSGNKYLPSPLQLKSVPAYGGILYEQPTLAPPGNPWAISKVEIFTANSISDTVICYQDVSAKEMYIMEYVVYHLKPYGIKYDYLKHSNRVSTSLPFEPADGGQDNFTIANTEKK